MGVVMAEEGSQGWGKVDGVTKNSLESSLRERDMLSSQREAQNTPQAAATGKQLRGFAEVGWGSVGLGIYWILIGRNSHPAMTLPAADLPLQSVSMAQREAGLLGLPSEFQPQVLHLDWGLISKLRLPQRLALRLPDLRGRGAYKGGI